MGQVGSSHVVIFAGLHSEKKWEAVQAEGIEIESDWVFHATDDLFQRLEDSETVLYAGEILQENLPPRERKILEALQSEILVPLKKKDQTFGFLSLGELLNGMEYLVEDLEFLKILGEIAGSVFQRVSQFEKVQTDLDIEKESNQLNNALIQVSKQFANVRKMDEAYDLLVQELKSKLHVKQFTFLVLDSETRTDYQGFGSNFLTPERLRSIKLEKDSDLIGLVSNVPGVYHLESFREDPEMKSIFTNDELGIMADCYLLPVINLNWVVGVVMIHSVSKVWTDTLRDLAITLLEMAAPTMANLLILSEKEALYRNPFNPLETRIRKEFESASAMGRPFTVSMFKVQNVARIIHVLGSAHFARFADNLRKSILDHISEEDFFTRVGQGKFAMILHAKDKEETEIVTKKIKAALSRREEGIV